MEQYQRTEDTTLTVAADVHGFSREAEPLRGAQPQPDIPSTKLAGGVAPNIYLISEYPNETILGEGTAGEEEVSGKFDSSTDSAGLIDQAPPAIMVAGGSFGHEQVPGQPATLASALSATAPLGQLESGPIPHEVAERTPQIDAHSAAKREAIAMAGGQILTSAPPSSPSVLSLLGSSRIVQGGNAAEMGGQALIDQQGNGRTTTGGDTEWVRESPSEESGSFLPLAAPMMRAAFPITSGMGAMLSTAIMQPHPLDEAMLAQLSTDIARLSRVGGEMNFSLTPISLGQVHVSLQHNRNQLRILLETETVEAKEILALHRSQIIDEARSNGLNVGDLAINHAKSHPNFSEQRPQNSSGHRFAPDQHIDPEGMKYEQKMHRKNAEPSTDLYA
ncbi:MAG: flagellar hook-length control protein FliK [Sphingopyxis sp.]